MHAAFKAWDRTREPLETTELRIHDGAPPTGLVERSNWYLDTLVHLFPWSIPKKGAVMMEIGSGLGHVMQAASGRYSPQRMIGLDVAPSMIEKAKVRLDRDRISDPRLEFLLYDGVTIPLPNNSVDYVYSVAALQHVPKTYVYNLFLEIKRILAPTGFCAIHLLSCNNIREHSRSVPFAQEIGSQLRNEGTHWHHFYAFDELLTVLADGVEAKHIDIVDGEVSIWASFAKVGPVFHRAKLPNQLHLARVNKGSVAREGAPSSSSTYWLNPRVAWLQGLSASRIVRGGARRVRIAAHRIRAALSGDTRVSTTDFRAAADVGGSHATNNLHAPTGSDAWPQENAMLPWYDQPDWSDRLQRMRHRPDDESMLRKWCQDGYVVVPELVASDLIDAFVGEIEDVWTRDDPIEGLAVSDVDLDDGHHIHVPHGELVRIDPAQRQRIKEISNWRVGQYHLIYSRRPQRKSSITLASAGSPRPFLRARVNRATA